jgi:hypothetical protein
MAEKGKKRIAIFWRCAVCYDYDDFFFIYIFLFHPPMDLTLVIHSGDLPDE